MQTESEIKQRFTNKRITKHSLNNVKKEEKKNPRKFRNYLLEYEKKKIDEKASLPTEEAKTDKQILKNSLLLPLISQLLLLLSLLFSNSFFFI